MHRLAIAAATIAVMLFHAYISPASAASRIALVISNSAYQGAPPLNTSAADANLIATTLQAAGYDVSEYTDLTKENIGSVFAPVLEKIKAAGPDAIVFFYFTGYAAQSNGDDYLIPVDAQIKSADAVATEALPLSAVTKVFADVPAAARIIVLDASRDGGFGRGGGQPLAPGLALVGVPQGTLLAYSAAPDAVATDGNGANSPYAAALATLMRQPGLGMEQNF